MKKQFNRMKQLANQTVGRQVLCSAPKLYRRTSRHTFLLAVLSSFLKLVGPEFNS